MSETVVLLTLDAARADHCSLLGYNRETTPRLAELESDGTTFTNCIAQSSHTRESMPSMLHSVYPSQIERVGFAPETPSVAEVFASAGYDTAGFHSNPYLSRTYGFESGFETFDDDLPRLNNRLVTFLHRVQNYFQTQPYVTAKTLVEKGRKWLATTTSHRRFLWLHFMDPHGPYQPPESYQRLFREEVVDRSTAKSLWRKSVDNPAQLTSEEQQILVDLYDAEIRYTDDIIRDFVAELRENQATDDLVIMIGSDHGDAFGEHDIFGHPRELYEELVHVPLLAIGDDVPVGQRRHQQVENVDIVPTLLDWAGIDIPESMVGEPLFTCNNDPVSDMDDRVVFSEATGEDGSYRWWAARTDGFKYVVQSNDNGEVVVNELWSLTDMDGDDRETRDVGDQYPDVRERLADKLDAHLDVVTSAPAGLTRESDTVDSAVEDRLDDLGYR